MHVVLVRTIIRWHRPKTLPLLWRGSLEEPTMRLTDPPFVFESSIWGASHNVKCPKALKKAQAAFMKRDNRDRYNRHPIVSKKTDRKPRLSARIARFLYPPLKD
ncbi:hypothetical protein AVEN_55353-1 [Araneus ventricosus]|uniref:Uncharacterized protein n=1 Tax=Araneus ventricosus TaxID=182803 RepID=A0A4Y2DC60_ARAVE|nr:hypothetical protein AVEN_55353-1 [Araneus ventricosus]